VDEEKYTIGTWHGHPCYFCTQCRFSSLKLEKVLAHYEAEHVIRDPRARARVARTQQITRAQASRIEATKRAAKRKKPKAEKPKVEKQEIEQSEKSKEVSKWVDRI